MSCPPALRTAFLCALTLCAVLGLGLAPSTAGVGTVGTTTGYTLPSTWLGYTPVSATDPLQQVSNTGLLSMTKGPAGSRVKGTWGVYGGTGDEAWLPYVNASTPKRKTQLGHIALHPKARWFGKWIADDKIAATVTDYITESQHGDRNAWVQMTIFRMDPWGGQARTQVPTDAQIRSYKRWIRRSAAAIGDTPTLLFLQPDSTTLGSVADPALSAGLIRYAAKIYGALPRTLVYLETGGWDWPHPSQGGAQRAAELLTLQGMRYADGVVTNTTHYNATAWDIERVAEIARIFAAKGQTIRGIINTSTSGHGIEFGSVGGRSRDHVVACTTREPEGRCVTLGIPPTTEVGAARWGLDAKHRRLARQYVDAYLWVGRPWLAYQSTPWQQQRALTLVKNSPFYSGPR